MVPDEVPVVGDRDLLCQVRLESFVHLCITGTGEMIQTVPGDDIDIALIIEPEGRVVVAAKCGGDGSPRIEAVDQVSYCIEAANAASGLDPKMVISISLYGLDLVGQDGAAIVGVCKEAGEAEAIEAVEPVAGADPDDAGGVLGDRRRF